MVILLRGYSWRLVSGVGAQERRPSGSVGGGNTQEATAVVLNGYGEVEKEKGVTAIAVLESVLRLRLRLCEILAVELFYGYLHGYLIASVIEGSRLYIFSVNKAFSKFVNRYSCRFNVESKSNHMVTVPLASTEAQIPFGTWLVATIPSLSCTKITNCFTSDVSDEIFLVKVKFVTSRCYFGILA